MNDPVWPGSLGLESLLQLLKVDGRRAAGAANPALAFESPVLGQTHRWTYRGQIVPDRSPRHRAGRDQGTRRSSAADSSPTAISKSTVRSSIRCTTSQSASRRLNLQDE